ncbi:MAG TPA: hypothetical protein VGL77_05525 [Armatimonadota bacterium]|jgi:hypothetical protein
MIKQEQSSTADAIFLEPVVRASCEGVPVYAYGFTHILGESPTLVETASLQDGNTARPVKVHPKKSWEISANLMGATPPRMPRTTANDYLPLEAIHLIDGDPQTCWCSRSQSQADVEPVWIRLDLAREQSITRIVLRKRPPGATRNVVGSMPLDTGAVEVGMALPELLTIRLSCDGRLWETVYEGPSGAADAREFVCDVPTQRAKQIWIIGRNLPRVENWLFSFSISSVEVYDAEERNIALASYGVGVTVSSTQHSMGQTIEEHRDLWPIHTDLGLKFVRVGYHDDPVNWHWVEKTRGELAVDAEADAAISYLTERGIDIMLSLGFGNRLYTQDDPTRKLPQLWEWYYENPAPPTTPEALEAWGRYVRYMAEHFRDRVRYFEIWNEWNIPAYWGAAPNVAHYLAIARVTIPILREVCPDAKIVLGSIAGFTHGISSWSVDELAAQEENSFMLRAINALARDVDVIGWHPFYQTNPESANRRNYIADVRCLRDYCHALGFTGELMATEWNYAASYPAPTPPNWWGDFECSEIAKAKYVAQITLTHIGLGVASFFCETWSSYYPLDLTLLRRSFAADPISPQQPQAAYYVMRNLATALEGLAPVDVAYSLQTQRQDITSLVMQRDGEIVVALWTPGLAQDDCVGEPCELTLAGSYRQVFGYDPMNGTEQPLTCVQEEGSIRLPHVRVMDYPILLRFVR